MILHSRQVNECPRGNGGISLPMPSRATLMKTGKLILVSVLLCCSGCGTFFVRSEGGGFFTQNEKLPRCYPATYIDGSFIGESFTHHKVPIGERCIGCVGAVIDLPVSLVTDTLILPYDACKSSGQQFPPLRKLPEPTTNSVGSSAPRAKP